jgi:DNA polymerase-3 subunit epsilon
MYAIVDIETTGSYAAANGITEISIQLSDGQTVTGQYNTLINPGQPIPPYISAMTGISNQMVAKAPRFEEVAEKVFELLQGRIFIAHNVSFDYSFVKSHLREAGFELNTKKLCTVRLSRKIIPGLPSYSLGKLSRSLGIEITDRHRASGDAAATATIFHLLLANDKEQHIQKSLQRNSKEWILPPNVPKEHFDALPYTPGVYYFHNEKGKVVYVGKATNIRYRVNSHFSNNSESRQKQHFMQHVYAISYQPCATELMACILESAEIKKRWPVFNTSQKRWEDIYGIFLYEDRRGYLRLGIDKNRKRLHPVYTFHYLVDGHAMIRKPTKTNQVNAWAPQRRELEGEKPATLKPAIVDKGLKEMINPILGSSSLSEQWNRSNHPPNRKQFYPQPVCFIPLNPDPSFEITGGKGRVPAQGSIC